MYAKGMRVGQVEEAVRQMSSRDVCSSQTISYIIGTKRVMKAASRANKAKIVNGAGVCG
jgi:hypothetical protein